MNHYRGAGRGKLLLTMEKPYYIAPEIEVIDVVVEQGFAASQSFEDIDRKNPVGWDMN